MVLRIDATTTARPGPDAGRRWPGWPPEALSDERRARPASLGDPRREVDRDRPTAGSRRRPRRCTSGTWFASRKLWKIQIGSVLTPPAVKIVTMTSSNDSAKASRRAREQRRAEGRERHPPERLPGVAPRSADASSNELDVRRSRAIALL